MKEVIKIDRLVYICSPYHAESKEELERNIRYAQELTREVIIQYADIPITPHLYITQALDDNISCERHIGTCAALKLLEKCDYMLVGSKYGISKGMKREIEKAKELNIPIEYIENK